ncbi:hypothetical protein [Okeania sp. SIO2B3]|uniref:hypothetical protein n=1 Tax=Okeania sp. SIO2B3 TaxID=2607784 RepID=UPI0025F9C960|nr:hypothetical protein [Okeania sp. SIO2B3]
MQVSEKITKIGSIAEIRECQTTGNKSLYATVEFKPGQIISNFRDQKNYRSPQLFNRLN